MTINIITPNGSGDSLVYTCPRTAIAAEVTGSEVSSGEGKLEFKTTTSGTSATKMTINGAGLATFTGATTGSANDNAALVTTFQGTTSASTARLFVSISVNGAAADFSRVAAIFTR